MADREILEKKILVDTNVMLDVLLQRKPFYRDSFFIFQLSDSKRIIGIISAISMTNAFFILQKTGKGIAEVYQDMDDINGIFTVAAVSDNTITTALALRWKDFEDAIQFVTAKENAAEFIITRNKEDFNLSDIPCITPTEFIAYLKEKENE